MVIVNVSMGTLGVGLVLLALRDVFHTLFHPSDRGLISATLCSAVWFLAQRMGTRARQLAGPGAVVASIGVWMAMLVVGYAMVYFTLAPDGLTYGPGVERAGSFADACYLSLTAISTLGFGDLVIGASPLRLLAPVEALTGFVVLTVAIAWVGQIYPALLRRRSMAVHVSSFWTANSEVPVSEPSLTTLARTWISQVSALVVDLVQNAETYYFRERDPRMSLGSLLTGLYKCASRLRGGEGEEARAAGRELEQVLGQLLETLHEQYGVPSDREEALRFLVADARSTLSHG